MRRNFGAGRIIIGVILAAIALISYFTSTQFNPVTEEEQRVALTPEQEIALGLQTAPQMAAQHGGALRDNEAQAFLDNICSRLIRRSVAQETEWPFECTLLSDPQTVNAFALPGGPTFITAALYNDLGTEGQVAGVMAHEIGHVLARHSAEQLAKQQLTQGLTGAFVIASYDPEKPQTAQTAQVAAAIGQLLNMRFSRESELEADRLGVRLMAEAGYDPRALIEVMRVLEEAGGAGPPEFFSTHPNPENRIAQIEAAIAERFPNGVPADLID